MTASQEELNSPGSTDITLDTQTMKILCEAEWDKEGELKEDESLYERGQFFLLHWGLQYQIIDLGEGRFTTANWTVAICEDCKTGAIRCFLPEQLRILGQQIKE